MTNNLTGYTTTRTFNVSEAKTHFSSVVDLVEKGETILISKRNIPVATIVAVPKTENSTKRHHTKIGWAKGTGVRILSDLTEPVPVR